MKTTYKIFPLFKKGYPTPFWIALSDSHIGRPKPASFSSTGAGFHTINPSIGFHSDDILIFPDCSGGLDLPFNNKKSHFFRNFPLTNVF